MVKLLQGYRVCRHVMVLALLVWMGAWAKHALAASGHQNKPAPIVVSVVPIVDRLNQALLDRTAVDIL
jgi:hypothetical protein